MARHVPIIDNRRGIIERDFLVFADIPHGYEIDVVEETGVRVAGMIGARFGFAGNEVIRGSDVEKVVPDLSRNSVHALDVNAWPVELGDDLAFGELSRGEQTPSSIQCFLCIDWSGHHVLPSR